MNSQVVVQDWNEAALGPLTEAAIRSLHTPCENYRISPFHYPPGTKFNGSMRSGHCYVIQGGCEYLFEELHEPIYLCAGDTVQLPEGRYVMEVLGSEELHIVLVWEIPPEFRNPVS